MCKRIEQVKRVKENFSPKKRGFLFVCVEVEPLLNFNLVKLSKQQERNRGEIPPERQRQLL